MYEKDPRYIKFPSTYLKSLFVNTDKSEKPNQPRYVKHKRRSSIFVEKYDESSSSEISDYKASSDDYEITILTKKQRKTIRQYKSKTFSQKKPNPEKDKETTNPSTTFETHDMQMERLLATEKISLLSAHIPSWGAQFNHNGSLIKVINTCTIDNYLFALWVLSKVVKNFFEKIPKLEQTKAIIDIINNIDIYQWDIARQIWFTDIMKEDISSKQQINFFGTVEDYFLKYMYVYQKHNLIQQCSKECINNGNLIISEQSDVINLGKLKNVGTRIVTDLSSICSVCKMRVTCLVNFNKNPVFLFAETTSHFKINDLPKTIEIENKTYKLLCAILYLSSRRHFVSVFDIYNKKYLIDDMSSEKKAILLNKNLKNHLNYFKINISSALYYLLEENTLKSHYLP